MSLYGNAISLLTNNCNYNFLHDSSISEILPGGHEIFSHIQLPIIHNLILFMQFYNFKGENGTELYTGRFKY